MSTVTDSKYDFIDHETYRISRSIWTPLTKKELMELPWIREAFATPGAKLFINYCLGFTLVSISEGGAIICNKPDPAPIYILKNTTKPSRLRLDEMYHDEIGFVNKEPLNSTEIYWTSVSCDHIQKVFSPGPISYAYDTNGQLTDEDNLSINKAFRDYDY